MQRYDGMLTRRPHDLTTKAEVMETPLRRNQALRIAGVGAIRPDYQDARTPNVSGLRRLRPARDRDYRQD